MSDNTATSETAEGFDDQMERAMIETVAELRAEKVAREAAERRPAVIVIPALDGTHRTIEPDAIRALVQHVDERDGVEPAAEPTTPRMIATVHEWGGSTVEMPAGRKVTVRWTETLAFEQTFDLGDLYDRIANDGEPSDNYVDETGRLVLSALADESTQGLDDVLMNEADSKEDSAYHGSEGRWVDEYKLND